MNRDCNLFSCDTVTVKRILNPTKGLITPDNGGPGLNSGKRLKDADSIIRSDATRAGKSQGGG